MGNTRFQTHSVLEVKEGDPPTFLVTVSQDLLSVLEQSSGPQGLPVPLHNMAAHFSKASGGLSLQPSATSLKSDIHSPLGCPWVQAAVRPASGP